MSRTGSSRIVYQGGAATSSQLNKVSDLLGMPKVRVVDLAVAVLADISDRLSQGATLVVRDQTGRERELYFPQIRQAAEAHSPTAETVAP